jgi:hypothetical protein
MPWPSAFSDRNLEIYDRFQAGESRQSLAAAYGIGPTRIGQIIYRIDSSRRKDDLAKGRNRWEELDYLRRKVQEMELLIAQATQQNKLLTERLSQIRNLARTD